MGQVLPPINFKQWIEDNRHLLEPPVGNKKIWEDSDFDVFVVGGPNARKDYHINHSEEFFYMIEGDMVLEIVNQDDQFEDIAIGEGEIFLLPARVPHSPQRKAETIGLVIEHQRPEGVDDGLRWYCDECGEVVYETYFHLTDITDELKSAIEDFWASDQRRTCDNCGAYLTKA